MIFNVHIKAQGNKYVHFEQKKYIIPWQNTTDGDSEWGSVNFYNGDENTILWHGGVKNNVTTIISTGEHNINPLDSLLDEKFDVQTGSLMNSGFGIFKENFETRYLGSNKIATIGRDSLTNECYLSIFNLSTNSQNMISSATKGYYDMANKFHRLSCYDNIPQITSDGNYWIIEDNIISPNGGTYFSYIFNEKINRGTLADTNLYTYYSNLVPLSNNKYLYIDGSRISLLNWGKDGANLLEKSMYMNDSAKIDDFVILEYENLIIAQIDGSIFMGNYKTGYSSKQIDIEELGFFPSHLFAVNIPGDFHILLQGDFGEVAVINLEWDDDLKEDRYIIKARGFFGGYNHMDPYFSDHIGNAFLYHEDIPDHEKLRIFKWKFKDKTEININESNVKTTYYPEYNSTVIELPININPNNPFSENYVTKHGQGDSGGMYVETDEKNNKTVIIVSLDPSDYEDWEIFNDSLQFKLELNGHDYWYDINVNIPTDKLIISSSIENSFVFDAENLIFPNPVTDELTIDMNNIEQLQLFDSTGKIIYNEISNHINMSQWNSGIYFLHIVNNGKVITKKIIKI